MADYTLAMPGYKDYGDIMSMNPIAAGQAYDQMGLARQFANEGLAQQQNATQKGFLENQFTTQDNPNRIQERILSNQGKGILNQGYSLDNEAKTTKNSSDKLDLTSKQDLYDDKQKQLHSQIATALSDNELAQASNHYLKLYQQAKLSNNAEGMQQYGGILDTLTGAVASKAADRVQKRDLQEGDWMQRSRESQLNRDSAERIAEIRKPIGKAPTSPDQIAAKLGYEKGAAYYLIKAEEADTPEEAEKYRALAAKFEQLKLNAATAAAGVNKPDIGALGVQTLPPQPSVIQPGKQPSVADMRKALKGQ